MSMYQSDYKDPLYILESSESWGIGCRACAGSQYDKVKRKYKCDLSILGHPNLDKTTCDYWRKKERK